MKIVFDNGDVISLENLRSILMDYQTIGFIDENRFQIEHDEPESTALDRGSIRKTALLKAGARPNHGVHNFYDIPRFDTWFRSRRAGHNCHKDRKSYRPWRRNSARKIRDEFNHPPKPEPSELELFELEIGEY